MTSEPKEFTKPTRNGRMTGVNISIDGETWGYCLTHMGLPANTPANEFKIRRYATKGNKIILKIIHEPANPQETPVNRESVNGGASIPPNGETPQMPPKTILVIETSITGGE